MPLHTRGQVSSSYTTTYVAPAFPLLSSVALSLSSVSLRSQENLPLSQSVGERYAKETRRHPMH